MKLKRHVTCVFTCDYREYYRHFLARWLHLEASRSPQWLLKNMIAMWFCIRNRHFTVILCRLRNVWVEISTKFTEILKSHGNNVFSKFQNFTLSRNKLRVQQSYVVGLMTQLWEYKLELKFMASAKLMVHKLWTKCANRFTSMAPNLQLLIFNRELT